MKRLFSRHPDFSIGFLLLAVAVGMMVPYLLNPSAVMWPRSDLGTDFLTYHLPGMTYLRQTLAETGYIPLWQSSTMSGLPMIGNPALRIYYPAQLVMALLPLPVPFAFALLNVLFFWLTGIGGYGLARHVGGIHRFAALVAALALMLTPRLSANITGDPGHTHGLLMVPLTLYLIWRALDRQSWRWALAAGVSLASLLILDLVFSLYLAWFIGLYVLFKLFWVLREQRATLVRWLAGQIGLLALIGIIAVGLSAYQMFPFFSYLPYQSRDAMTLANANYLALPLPLLINAVAPSAQKFPEWELYVGLLPLVLMPLAFLYARRRQAFFWFGVFMFAAVFSLGSATPVYTLMFEFVPGFRFLRVAPRMWYFGAIAASLLLGIAVDYLMQAEGLSRRWWRWLGGAASLLILMTVAIRFFTRRPEEPDWLLGFVAAVGVVLALVALWRWQQDQLAARMLGGVLLVALLIDLVPVAFAFHYPRMFDETFSTPDFVYELPRDDLYRLYTIRRELLDRHAVLNNLEVVEGLNSFQFASYAQMMRVAAGCELEGIAAAVPPCISNEIEPEAYLTAVPDPVLLGLLNVRFVVSSFDLAPQPELTLVNQDGEYRVYENAAVLPRAFAVGRLEVVDDDAAVLDGLRTLDPRESVLIDRAQVNDFAPPAADFYVPAEVVRAESDHVRLQVSLPEAGMLVFSQPWVAGWQAIVDEVPAPVLRVDLAMQGLYLPAGDHAVEFYFAPPAFSYGLGVTAVTLVLVAAAGFVLWRQARAAH